MKQMHYNDKVIKVCETGFSIISSWGCPYELFAATSFYKDNCCDYYTNESDDGDSVIIIASNVDFTTAKREFENYMNDMSDED